MSGRVGNALEETGHVITIVSVNQVATFKGTAHERHGRFQGIIDDLADGVFRVGPVDIWRTVTSDVGAVISAIWITGNAIPVKGGGVEESANRHGGTGLDLVSAGDDGGFEDPEELIGVAIGVATCAGKGSGGGGACGVEDSAAALEGGRGGVVERNGGFQDGPRGVGEIHERNGIGNGIEDPGLGGSAIDF